MSQQITPPAAQRPCRRSASAPAAQNLPCPLLEKLPVELVVKIFSILFEDIPDAVRLSSTCRAMRVFTPYALREYLSAKETLCFSEIERLRPIVYQLLIAQNDAFQPLQSEDYPERQALLWERQTLPEMYASTVFRCTELKQLDLSHEHFSISTFLGELYPFAPFEMATQDLEEPPALETYSLDDEMLAKPVHAQFADSHPHPACLLKVHTLVIHRFSELEEIDEVQRVAETFPRLRHLIITGMQETEELQRTLRERLPNAAIEFSPA